MVARDVVAFPITVRNFIRVRFNLGSIPSTARSNLGLKIQVVRFHRVVNLFFSFEDFVCGTFFCTAFIASRLPAEPSSIHSAMANTERREASGGNDIKKE